MKIIYKRRYDEIVSSVVETLEKVGSCRLPISPLDIAWRLGIEVRKFSDVRATERSRLLLLQKDGFSYRYQKDKLSTSHFVIWYNDEMLEERIRWTISHELGHIVLKHLEESELAEAEANYFAATLLAAPIFIMMLKLGSTAEVQHILHLSAEAACNAMSRYYNRFENGPCLTQNERRLLQLFQGNTALDNVETTGVSHFCDGIREL